MTRTPVVLIAFNRPELTAQGLDVLRKAKPERLLLVCDGPRADRPAEPELTDRVRALFDGVDWQCVVERRFSSENLGCEANVELGLDWAFSLVDRAIVLEDDCLPDPSFFGFCDDLLDRYADDPRIWQIAGNRHEVPTALFGADSYAFSTWASVWGWATWADRWQQHRAVFTRTHAPLPGGGHADAPVRTVPAQPRPGTLVTPSGRRHFADAATSQDVITHGWDKHWWLTIMSAGGLCVTPAVNLVENDGFGAGATHGVSERRVDPAVPAPVPLRHPATVALDTEVERELELLLNRVGGPLSRLGRRLIRSPRIRTFLRAVAYSRPVVAATRTVSRLAGRLTRHG